MERSKQWGLIFLTAALLSLVVLAGGLSNLQFNPGSRLPVGEALGSPLTFGNLQIHLPSLGYIGALLSIFFWAAVVISAVQFIISPKARRYILRNLLRITGLYLALFLLLRSRRDLLLELTPEAPTIAAPPVAFNEIVQSSTDPPQWLALIFSVLLSAFILVVGWRLWRRTKTPEHALDSLVDEAQSAIGELQGGADWKSTILRCYHQMVGILSEQSGVKQHTAMTSREFEQDLKAVGMSGEHIHRLSRLFEEARYSSRVPGEQEEGEALACLQAIVDSYGNPA